MIDGSEYRRDCWYIQTAVCGRYTVSKSREVLGRFLDCEISEEIDLPIYNGSPGQRLPVILDSSPGEVRPALWGIRPSWAKEAGRLLINARAETVNERATFRASFRRRRCLVIADGFYEWKATRYRKLPFRITLTTGDPFAFAGIWEEVSGEPAYVILTTEANGVARPIHDRMPVILEAEERGVWLDNALSVREACDLLDPYPESGMKAYPVSQAVNNSANEGPELIEPV